MEQSDLDLLNTVPPYHLQSLVKLRRLSAASKGQGPGASAATTPATITIPEIAQHLFEPATISEATHGLNEAEGLILRELVACGGRANSRDIALYFTSNGVFNTVKGGESPLAITERGDTLYPVPHPHGPFEQALRRLLLLGLVFWGKQTNFAGRDYTSGVYDGVVIVPQAVKDVVNVEIRVERSAKADHPVLNPGEMGEDVRAFQRLLYLYWSFAASLREGLQLVNSGLLSRTVLRQVLELQGHKGSIEQIRTEQDVPRLMFVRLLLMNLGLLQERQGSILVAPAEAFFSLPLLERARRCYRLWLESSFWNELLNLPEVIVRPGPDPLDPAHEEVIRSRQSLMERVLDEQPGTWLAMSSFIARTKLYAPYLLFPRQYGARADRYSVGSNPYGWDFRLRRGWLTHREGWHLVEGGFIRAVVLGPLQWLGLVEAKNEGIATTFCVTPGASLVTDDDQVVDAGVTWGRLIVQPNFEVVALSPVSEALLIKLDRFAERIGLEHIAQYRITKASVTRAIQMGLRAETIQQVLEEAIGAGAEIPQNVSYSLVEWERQARRIEVWQGATLLEVDDATMLDELFAEEETRALLGRRLSPVLAEVTSHQLAALQEVFWRRDYLPALTATPVQDSLLDSGRLAAREPQWRLRNDGLLQPLYAVTDLFLAAEIERISTRDELTGWRKITPALIVQACSSGIALDAIIRFLQLYCEGGIPASFLLRLKLWGGGYGEQPAIQVEQSPMLYLPAKILEDLRIDQELGDLLGTEVAQEGRLVRVPAEHLERVVELLRERGFEVE
ncbi:MAG TPA: helicase-associated domain-containing protein [Ktedonobacteraceae bacterium]|nr:helicase-associated domain-containing protein [Ktedonobacteraceae bacterium]